MSFDFEMDRGLYRRLGHMCDELGMTADTVLKMFIMTSVRNDKIPFKIDEDILNTEIIAQKDRSMKDHSKKIKTLLDANSDSKNDRDALRSKIAEDIYNIEAVSNFTSRDYFKYKLYRMPKKEWVNSYISDDELKTLLGKINTPVPGVDMGDKYVCYNEFNSYYKREMVRLVTKNDKYDFIFFVKKHGRVIIKPRYGSSNLRIGILNYSDISDWDFYVSNLLSTYKNGIVAEEIIIQDDDMAIFNTSSVNTLRVVTFATDSKVQAFAFLRIGVNNSILDTGSRSLVCELDQNSGEILRVCNRNGNDITAHPDSNINLIGLQVSDIKHALKKAKEMAKLKPNYKYAAFDFAKTNKQWVLVDFNNRPDISDLQLALGRGFKQNIMKLVNNI